MNRQPLSPATPAAVQRWLCAGACVVALSSAAGAGAAERTIAVDQNMRAAVVRPYEPVRHLTVDCTGEARPDRAVIVGALTAVAATPLEVQAQLDRQLAEVRKYVAVEHGRLVILERVRAAGAMGGRDYGRRGETLPFLALQRVEIEFPTTVAIDAALERLLQAGLDRFGSNIRVDRVNRRRSVSVRYRFSALREALDQIHDRCRAEAIANSCAGEGTGLAVCALPAAERDARVRTRALSLKTQQLLRENGGSSRYHLNYPWRIEQVTQIEPIGDIAVTFQGTLQLQITDEP